MNILIVYQSTIPALLYGGTKRVIWSLGKEFVKLGHKVTYLVKKGSYCDFADVIYLDPELRVIDQIPENTDFVHFNYSAEHLDSLEIPYLITIHDNTDDTSFAFDRNTVFVSRNHAERHNSNSYVYNGLDWDLYTKPDWSIQRNAFHFLGKGSWKVKNLKGTIDIIKSTKSEKLNVLGAKRFEERVLKFGPAYVFSFRVSYKGMLGGIEKHQILNRSKGLIFPVLWHEPFGLAIIESLYYGCPIFATTYGSLQELVNSEVGFLSNRKDELVEAVENPSDFSTKTCHDYAADAFNSKKMAVNYLALYDRVISGEKLNDSHPQLKKSSLKLE